ncbi:natural killer cell receptor 2B4-like isoform X3 [Centrocercus urophasianus]|uniref:natural killer cell receptor 2B4-like isoform X3 n=1 Tax=Centrocercus urophasianus TaxID=9002 RepID=UPI001C64D1CF|nr:natural killer cell receptor 2B4-like isoform X3 [Centrocercus urophasianus]
MWLTPPLTPHTSFAARWGCGGQARTAFGLLLSPMLSQTCRWRKWCTPGPADCWLVFASRAFYLASARAPDIHGCFAKGESRAELLWEGRVLWVRFRLQQRGGRWGMKKKWTLPVWPESACSLSRAEGMLDGRLQYVARVQAICTKKCCPEGMEQQHMGCSTGVPIPDCPSAWGHCAHFMPSTGAEGCRDTAVLTGTHLQLLLEEPLPLEWITVIWRVELGAESRQRILTVWKDKVEYSNSSLSRRAIFHREPLSLQISAVTQADNGNYFSEIEKSNGSVSSKCFHVSVWEPVGSPHLETRVLQQEQGRCSFQLSCTMPEATAVSYSWSRDWEPLGNQSVLDVPKDVQPGLYVCNVSNPASWSTASIDTATACSQTGLFGAMPWWAVTVLLVLAVCIAGSTTYWCWRRRRKDRPAAPTPSAPPEHTEPSLTVYEEVGKLQTGQEPNGNSEAHMVGNTVYAVVNPKGQRPRSPQKPESCTIYSTVQHSMKSPSFKRKKLDRALVFTAYMEVTAPLRHYPSSQSSSTSPTDLQNS